VPARLLSRPFRASIVCWPLYPGLRPGLSYFGLSGRLNRDRSRPGRGGAPRPYVAPRPVVAALCATSATDHARVWWRAAALCIGFVVTSATLIEKCCLIANPVAGNPTQYLIEQAFAHKDLDWRFMTFEVEPERLGDAMRGIRALGFMGVKIGELFHESVIEHVDELTELARRCGSVNCITARGERLVGNNTEGPALVELLRQQVNPLGRRAMIVGTGRLARAIAVALADAGISAITVVSRNAAAGQQLVELIQQQTAATASHVDLAGSPITVDPEIAVLVNATSLGMHDPAAKLAIDPNSFGSKLVVADVAYNTSRTWLTQQAAERGCRIIDGLSLYVEQTALALRAWTGVMPDTVGMREAAEEFLGI
jgi:shikimate dehydrogenase